MGQELKDFQTKAETLENNLDNLGDGVDTLRDLLRPTINTLKVIEIVGEPINRVKKLVDNLEDIARITQKIPPISNVAKLLVKGLDAVGDSLEGFENSFSEAAQKTAPILKKLEKTNNLLLITDLAFEKHAATLSVLRSAAEANENGIAKLADVFDADGNPLDVSGLQNAADVFVTPANGVLDFINFYATPAGDAFADFDELLDPLDFSFGDFADELGVFEEIAEALEVLEVPFEALNEVIEPIQDVLDAVDTVYNFIVAPVVDPILESLGVNQLIEDAADAIVSLLPGADLLERFDAMMDEYTAFLEDLDADLPDAEFLEALEAFLNVTNITQGVTDIAGPVFQGLPFNFDLAGETPVNPETWTFVSDATFTASPDGGFVFGTDADQTLTGGIGADFFFGGAGDDLLINEAVGEPADVTNLFIGGAGDDQLIALGQTVVFYEGGIGEYLLSRQVEEINGVEIDFVEVQHIAKSGDPTGDGVDRVFFDDSTQISFGNLPVFNLEEFLLGYQPADENTPNLEGDRDENLVPNMVPRRDFLIGDTTDFLVPGSTQVNELIGYALDDFLSGGRGDDALFGGLDDDYLVGGEGFDTLDGGDGIDTASFVDLSAPVSAPFGQAVFGNDGTRGAQLFLDRTQAEAASLGFFLTDIVTGVENVIGSDFRDIVFGNDDQSNTLLGGAEGDILRGVGAGPGNGNLVAGGHGQDVLVLDSGKDFAAGDGGNDRFYVPLQAQFTDQGNLIDGGDGVDLITYSGFATTEIFGEQNGNETQVLFCGADFFGVRYGDDLDLDLTTLGGSIVVDAGAGTVTRVLDSGETAVDLFENVEAILGTEASDLFEASATLTPVDLHGGGGDDLFRGLGSGLNTAGLRDFEFEGNALFGGVGNDLFELFGSHEVHGGDGLDTLDLSLSEGFWLIDATALDWNANFPALEHFEAEDDLPPELELQDLFVRFNQINNPDPLPAFEDPSVPSNPFILTFDSPLEVGQAVTGIETIIGTDRRDVLLGGRDVQEIHGAGGDDYLGLRFDSDPQAIDFETPYPSQTLFGGDGDDHLIGHFGAEILYGGAGDDVIDTVANVFDAGPTGEAYGGDGADLFFALDYDEDGQFPGPQQIFGGEDGFQVVLPDGTIEIRELQDAVDFGDGEVSLLNNPFDGGVIISLDSSQTPNLRARAISLFGIENVFGTRDRDDIFGDEFDNVLIGRGENDELYGGDGEDILIGGQGDDRMFGGLGDDIFFGGYGDGDTLNGRDEASGGAGRDTLSYQFVRPDGRGATTVEIDSIGRAVVQLNLGIANLVLDDDNQSEDASLDLNLVGGVSDIENVTGGRGDDQIFGDDQINVLTGDAGNDLLSGLGGADVLIVGSGDDTADGGAEDDVIFGASGNNVFDGGEGTGDRLDFSSNTLGLAFDLDGEEITATYEFTTQVYADQADAGGTLDERAAVAKQSGSNDNGALGVRDITAADVYKIENPALADKYLHLEAGFVRSTLGTNGLALPSYAYVEQSEDRAYTNTATNFESFIAGTADDTFTYSVGTGFDGFLDGGAGLDTLDLSGIVGALGFSLVGDVFGITIDGNAQGLRFTNIETVITPTETLFFNTGPLAVDDTDITGKNTSLTIDVLDNDSDGNGDAVSVISFDASSVQGSVIDNGDGTFTYDTNGAFDALRAGELAVDIFSYTVSDGNGATGTAHVILTIDGDDDTPVAVDDDGFSTPEDTDLTINIADLLANDRGTATLTSVGNGTLGSAVLNGDQITFTPDTNANGAARFTYTIEAVSGGSSEATVNLTITPVNDAPALSLPLPDQASLQDEPIAFSLPVDAFTDVDGDALTLSAQLSGGNTRPIWLDFDADNGAFSGTPPLDFNGVLSIEVTASDGVLTAHDTFDLTITDVVGPVPILEVLGTAGTGDLVDFSNFDLLLSVLTATGVRDILDDPDLDATLFAPNDLGFVGFAEQFGYSPASPVEPDEADAFAFLLGQLTALGGGDPIPLLTDILRYHISPGGKLLADLPDGSVIPTWQGETIELSGPALVDQDPELGFGNLLQTDLLASNGVLHAITGVLLPWDIPTTNGLDEVRVLIDTSLGRGTLEGGDDNDLLIDGPDRDLLIGNGGGDVFQLVDDGARDAINDFERGADKIDVSAFGVTSFDQLTVTNLANRAGDVRWLNVADTSGEDLFVVRFGDGTALDAGNLQASDFVFSDTAPAPVDVTDTNALDVLTGTRASEIFLLENDGLRDVVKQFDVDSDVIDVSAFGATQLDDLTIEDLRDGSGQVRWISITDPAGQAEIVLRFTEDTPLNATALSADSFIFADAPLPPEVISDTPDLDLFRGTPAREVFQLQNDDVLDALYTFEQGADQIDVSALGATGLGDLTFDALRDGNDVVRWLQITDTEGDAELVVRFSGGTPMDIGSFAESDFVFS